MIWTFYAALLALLFVSLSIRTLRPRRRLKIAVGDGGNPVMLRAMRVHANFAEYVLLGLLLVPACETVGAPHLLVHLLGIALLTGRIVHAFGLSREPEVFAFRVTGMPLTFTCYLVASTFVLWQARGTLDERTVDVHVLRLREALREASSLLKTVRGLGYKLSAG